MFIIDKYNVKTLDDIIFHKKIYENLVIGYEHTNRYHTNDEFNKIIISKNYNLLNNKPNIYKNYYSMPNLLIHGQSGSGKHTLIRLLLNDIFDETIDETFIETYNIKGYGNAVVDVNIEQSKYHLIFEPNNSGLDKYIILEIIKDYATKKIINSNFPFRIVLINNIDNLNYNSQTSLRCIMEKYSNTCRFILCCNQITKIIDPIKSRCIDIRLKLPNKDELIDFIYKIILSEQKILSNKKIENIIRIGENNIKKTLWTLQMSLYGIKNLSLSWSDSINILLKIMYDFKTSGKDILNEKIILITRNILYNIFTTNISSINILYDIVNKIMYSDQFNIKLNYQILQLAADVEYRLNMGKRSTIHLDYFLCSVYECIYNFYHV